MSCFSTGKTDGDDGFFNRKAMAVLKAEIQRLTEANSDLEQTVVEVTEKQASLILFLCCVLCGPVDGCFVWFHCGMCSILLLNYNAAHT